MLPVGGACGTARDVAVDVEAKFVRATSELVVLGTVIAGAILIWIRYAIDVLCVYLLTLQCRST